MSSRKKKKKNSATLRNPDFKQFKANKIQSAPTSQQHAHLMGFFKPPSGAEVKATDQSVTLFYSTFTKGSLELPNNQTDGKLIGRTQKVTIPSPSPAVRPHHHSGNQTARLTSEVVTAAVRVVAPCKMSLSREHFNRVGSRKSI